MNTEHSKLKLISNINIVQLLHNSRNKILCINFYKKYLILIVFLNNSAIVFPFLRIYIYIIF